MPTPIDAAPDASTEGRPRLKILQIHNTYLQEGGEDRLVEVEAAALRRSGIEVVVAQVANPDRVPQQVRDLVMAPWNPASSRQIGSLADKHQPDLAHVHNTWYRFSPSVISALKRRDIPVVMTVHNYRLMCANALFFRNGTPCTDCLGKGPWRSVIHRCYRDSATQSLLAAGTISLNRSMNTWQRGIDRYVVATEFVRDLLVESGFPIDRIRIVRPLIPDVGERPNAPSSSSAVVYVGRVEEGKGLRTVLDAWKRTDTDLELVIVGDGDLVPELRGQSIPRTRFVGWKDRGQVNDILRSARAFVFPSRYFETLGLSLAEALAAGLPVIAGAVGTRSEVLGGDGAGWLVEADSVPAWADALGVLTDDAAVDQAGRAARRRYETEFAPAVAIERLRSVYREAQGE